MMPRRDAMGERALMCAVLTDAIRCLSEWRRQPGPAAEAWRWVMSRDREWPFAFENLCDALGFRIDVTRRRFIEGTPSLEALRQVAAGNASWCGARPSPPPTATARTARDAAVLQYRAEGLTLAEIARAVGLSISHVANICKRTFHGADHPREQALTPRQQTIVRLVALGLGPHEIAAKLGISPATAKVHLTHVFRILDVHDRQALVDYARRAGLAEAEAPEPDGPGAGSPEHA